MQRTSRPKKPCHQNTNRDLQANASIQGTRNQEYQKKHVILCYVAKGFQWLTLPIRWFYGLVPIEKFTAALCIIGGMQTWAFIQSERAFATVSAMQIIGGMSPDKNITLLIEIKNSGKSTAFIEALNTTVAFAPDRTKLPIVPPYAQGQDVSSGPILANNIVKVRTTINVVLDDDRIKGINDGSHKMYVIGFVSFVDDFSIFGPRINGFCVLYNPKSGDAASSFDDCGNRAYTYSR